MYDKLVVETIQKARDNGVSWERIGRALGVSRQAATERYHKGRGGGGDGGGECPLPGSGHGEVEPPLWQQQGPRVRTGAMNAVKKGRGPPGRADLQEITAGDPGQPCAEPSNRPAELTPSHWTPFRDCRTPHRGSWWEV